MDAAAEQMARDEAWWATEVPARIRDCGLTLEDVVPIAAALPQYREFEQLYSAVPRDVAQCRACILAYLTTPAFKAALVVPMESLLGAEVAAGIRAQIVERLVEKARAIDTNDDVAQFFKAHMCGMREYDEFYRSLCTWWDFNTGRRNFALDAAVVIVDSVIERTERFGGAPKDVVLKIAADMSRM